MPVKLEWLGYHMVEKLWRYVKPFLYNTGVSRTDRQTDRRTDGRTELLYQYRASAAVCWLAIKINQETPDLLSKTKWHVFYGSRCTDIDCSITKVTKWVSWVWRPTQHIIEHFRDESFQPITWLWYWQTKPTTKTKPNKTSGLVASYNIRPGNRLGLLTQKISAPGARMALAAVCIVYSKFNANDSLDSMKMLTSEFQELRSLYHHLWLDLTAKVSASFVTKRPTQTQTVTTWLMSQTTTSDCLATVQLRLSTIL